MKRANLIKDDLQQTQTLEGLTSIFESIASIHIAKIRHRVVASKQFFAELWQVYSSLRVDKTKRLKTHKGAAKGSKMTMVITGDGKFGGDINDKILETFMQYYSADPNTEIVAFGGYGASKLKQKGIKLKRAFRMPDSDVDFNINAVIDELKSHEQITVFYQTYDSLRVQKVARIDLLSKVKEYAQDAGDSKHAIDPSNYIFEPDMSEIVNYLESVMMGIALTQIVMETKLASYAARYNTMSMAKKQAGELVGDFQHEFYRAKRAESDERTKEAIKAFKQQSIMEGSL